MAPKRRIVPTPCVPAPPAARSDTSSPRLTELGGVLLDEPPRQKHRRTDQLVRARRANELADARRVEDLVFGGRDSLSGQGWAIGDEGPQSSEIHGITPATGALPGCLALVFQLGTAHRVTQTPRFARDAAQNVSVADLRACGTLDALVAAYGGEWGAVHRASVSRRQVEALPPAVRAAVRDPELAPDVVRACLEALPPGDLRGTDEEVRVEALDAVEDVFAQRWPEIAGYLREVWRAASCGRWMSYDGDPALPSHAAPRLLPGHGAVRPGERVGRFVVAAAADVCVDGQPMTEYAVDWGATYGPAEPREDADPPEEMTVAEAMAELGLPAAPATRTELLRAVRARHPDRGGARGADMDRVRRARDVLGRGVA